MKRIMRPKLKVLMWALLAVCWVPSSGLCAKP